LIGPLVDELVLECYSELTLTLSWPAKSILLIEYVFQVIQLVLNKGDKVTG